MKFTCKQQDLSRGLSVVSHAVSSRSTLPILANVLLSAEQGRLKLAATNLEIGINCWVEAQIEEEGTTTVPARLFTELVNSLPQGAVQVTAQADTHVVNLQCLGLGINTNVKGMDPSEFPLIPTAEGGEPPILLEAPLLKEMISQVAFAAAKDESRPVFTGVLVQVRDEQVTFVAADAFRLATRTAPLPGAAEPREDILIPARTLTELARILPNEGPVEMIVTPNHRQVLFHTEQIDLVSRLLDGTFPNYRAIIPAEYKTRAVLETKALTERVKAAALFARNSSNITRLKISPQGSNGSETGSVTIEATAEDLGDTTSTLNAAVDGEEIQIIFNVDYLVDVLNVLDAPEVALEVTSPMRPGVLRPVDATDYTYVIMPMHTNRS
ncbi:DNA polymerase III subunit beta [Thermogemmatispora carboxidivorans]|uniref:DNA polymerase III subunit beta n=1 Tax=Thermogemmatispora carboxidivorans TaxID=1382306 RepID=UPI00138E3881|nr:DNA polymerase III subunit beta [Thermogemmatispora carboxidivorans]